MPYVNEAELNFAKLQQLIAEAIHEDQTLEFKREIGVNKEIAKDVCAFANGQGGLILYGIAETPEKRFELVGLEGTGVLELIDNVIATSVAPRVKVSAKQIPIPDSDKFVVAIFIPESDQKPHMVSAYEDRRFYVRRNAINIKMDQMEIEDAYRMRTRTQEAAEAFASFVINKRYTLTYPEPAWASFICVPKANAELVPITEVMQEWLAVRTNHYRHLFLGVPSVDPRGFQIRRDDPDPVPRYGLVGREGFIEMAGIMNIRGREYLPTLTLAELVLNFLDFCSSLYDHIGYYGVVRLSLRLEHIEDLRLGLSQEQTWFEAPPKFRTNEVNISRDEAAGALRGDRERIGKLFMDRVYQGAGLMSCDLFDAGGRFVRPR